MIFPGQIKAAIIIVNLLLISVSYAIIRPPVPNITDVSFDGNNITIQGSVDTDSCDSIHVVLLSDFTPSLGYANEMGNDFKEGLVITYASKSFPIVFPPSMQSRERYFIAALTSKKNEDSIKVFSGWKVYTDSSGLPLSISTSSGSYGENLFYRARRINESDSSQVVFDVTFSLPVSRASQCKFILKQGSTEIINLSDLSSIPNAKSDIKDALQNSGGIGKTLYFMETEKGFNLYRFYGYLNESSDKIVATLIDTAGLVMDTLENQVGIGGDIGHMNIISTIYALTAMPSSVIDPLNPGTIPSLTDSSKIRLLITAMVDLSLAHNSPQADENEQKQGIFTNYMQFMDNVVGKWDSVRTSSPGVDRASKIHGNILNSNKNKIIDPVYIKNYGTLAEYGQPVQQEKRKNYAFYEGYSRLKVDLDLWPDSSITGKSSKTGIGVMFRISDNIELYEADLADTFNIFDSAFLSGGPGNRRIIFYANDSILDKFNRDGLWVKGIDTIKDEEQWYIGIAPIRLSIKGISKYAIGSSFKIFNENWTTIDQKGVLAKGIGNNILKVKTISINTDSTLDILSNSETSRLVPLTQSRIYEYDKLCLENKGVFLRYHFLGDKDLLDNILSRIDSNTIKIEIPDTVTRADSIKILIFEYLNRKGTKLLSRCFFREIKVGSLAIKGGYSNNFNRLTDGILAVPIEKKPEKLLPFLLESKGKINVRSTNYVKVFTSRDTSNIINQILPDTNKYFISKGASGTNNDIWIDWKYFYDNVITKFDSLYIVVKDGSEGNFVIGYCDAVDLNSKTAAPTSGTEEKISVVRPKVFWDFPPNRDSYFGYDIKGFDDESDYLSVPCENVGSRIRLLLGGVKKTDIKDVNFTSSNLDVFTVDNWRRDDLQSGIVFSIAVKSKETSPGNSLEWLNASITNSLGDQIERKIGIVSYKWKYNNPIWIALCEDDLSSNTQISPDNPFLSIPNNILLDDINRIYKQAIMKLNGIEGLKVTNIRYDLNNNGILDYYINDGSGNPEMRVLAEYLNSLRGNDISNIGIGYVNKIHTGYELFEPAIKNLKTIKIKYSSSIYKKINKGDVFTIGGNNSKGQVIMVIDDPIESKIEGQIIATLSLNDKLLENHNITECIWDDKAGIALTGNIIFITQSGDETSTLAHELLHLDSFGGLSDVGKYEMFDKDNIMYFRIDRKNKLLKFRRIPTVKSGTDNPNGAYDMQWDLIHNFNRP